MPIPILPGDGRAWCLPSNLLSTLMFFGLDENSFPPILLFPSFGFCSCGGSGVDTNFGDACGCCVPSMPGELSGLRGKAAFAALVAAILPPPTPFEYVMPFVLNVTCAGTGGGLMGWPRPAGAASFGAGIVVERLRLCWGFEAYAAWAAICEAVRWDCEAMALSRSRIEPSFMELRLGSK